MLDPLLQLHSLTMLDLTFAQPARFRFSVIGGCRSLTRLRLCGDLIVDELASMLSTLPVLRDLCLVDIQRDLASLSFLAVQSTLALSLQVLTLHSFARLPAAEIRLVDGLKALQRLTITSSFVEPLNDELLALYTPPSAILPALVDFRFTPANQPNPVSHPRRRG